MHYQAHLQLPTPSSMHMHILTHLLAQRALWYPAPESIARMVDKKEGDVGEYHRLIREYLGEVKFTRDIGYIGKVCPPLPP